MAASCTSPIFHHAAGIKFDRDQGGLRAALLLPVKVKACACILQQTQHTLLLKSLLGSAQHSPGSQPEQFLRAIN